MASKKHRKQLRRFYNRQAVITVSPQEEIGAFPTPKEAKEFSELAEKSIRKGVNEILDSLKGYSVVFPEIVSDPIKLGTPLEVTLQIGEDKPQGKRIVFAVLLFNAESYEIKDQLRALQKLKIDRTKKVIMASPAHANDHLTPVIEVIYPIPMGGYALTPMTFFEWYGREKIVITEIAPCPEATFLANKPHYKFWEMLASGKFRGRQIDGLEIFGQENEAI